jgi:small subunit ribosomal protein S4
LARYIGPACRLCRREGTKLYLKGVRCKSHKCVLEKGSVAPGQHGASKKGRGSDYGMQLREKQKAKRMFGILEKQFRLYFKKAETKKGVTGENLFIFIETRLDNVVYRLGFASSRKLARQLISHKHFLVNGKGVNKASYLLKEGDVISLKEKSKEIKGFKELIEKKENLTPPPTWLEFNVEKLEGKVVRLPKREDMNIPVDEQKIVELYSK